MGNYYKIKCINNDIYYYYKVLKNGNKTRIGKDEYYKKIIQKGGYGCETIRPIGIGAYGEIKQCEIVESINMDYI